MKTILLASAIAFTVIACNQKPVAPAQATAVATPQSATPAPPSPALPPGHPSIPAQTATAQSQGVVLETLDAAGFTYMKLRTAKGEEWVVVPTVNVKKGATVVYAANMTTDNFESKTLNRKFDRVTFANVVTGAEAGATPMMSSSAPPQESISVDKATGDDAKTVAEIWAAKSTLADKNVVVRGKVVKFLPSIMGKNWIHLRDGSGSHEKGDDDITVTTTDNAAVGDIVTVNGVVHIDKDFGSGYRYAVIVENGKVTK